jgi:hypothetical protein
MFNVKTKNGEKIWQRMKMNMEQPDHKLFPALQKQQTISSDEIEKVLHRREALHKAHESLETIFFYLTQPENGVNVYWDVCQFSRRCYKKNGSVSHENN